MSSTVSTPWLVRLMAEGLYSLVKGSDRLHARMVPGGALVLSGAPFADLNGILVWGGPEPKATLASLVSEADDAGVPFLAILGPDVAGELTETCERLDLVHATTFPLMGCRSDAFTIAERSDVDVARVTRPSDLSELVGPMVRAFRLELGETLRTLPFELFCGPDVDGWIARTDGRTVGCVVTTIHGDHVGIWAMATDPSVQRKGIGRALLTRVMDHHVGRGADGFFLGATPAGRPLYAKIGYDVRTTTDVWVRGETAQS